MTKFPLYRCWIFIAFTGSIFQMFGESQGPFKSDLLDYFPDTTIPGQTGTGHGSGDVGADLLQSIGQVVIDKATGAAFAALKTKIQSFLSCEKCDKGMFSQTCVVLSNLRLEEITTSYNALYSALLSDIGSLVIVDTIRTNDANFAKVVKNIISVLFTELSQPRRGIPVDISNIIVSSLQEFFNNYADTIKDTNINNKAILLSAATLLIAKNQSITFGNNKFESLDITGAIAKVNSQLKIRLAFDSEQYSRSVRVASNLHKALTAKQGSAPTDVRTRVAAALDAFIEIALMFQGSGLDEKAKAIVKGGSNQALFVFRDIIDAIIYHDVNALVIASCTGIQIGMMNFKKDIDSAIIKRGIRLAGAVLLYAETYADTSISKELAQAKRTSILASLVQDRTAKDGVIFSTGGSLRGICAWRLPRLDNQHKVTSPFWGVSLPIGFGLDWYWTWQNPVLKGLHIDVDPFDLGQFVSYTADKKIVMQKPDVADVFCPGLTVGINLFTTSYPVFAGYNLGFSPNYSAPEGSPLKGGTTNHAVVLGIYIPLYDFN